MAFQTALTIKETIANIHSKKYLLPSIQREFVWDVDQITQLFDSLMLGYPIGSFLFWEVSPANVKEFVFYEFLRNYHEQKKDGRHNPKASIIGNETVTAILDGQQRLKIEELWYSTRQDDWLIAENCYWNQVSDANRNLEKSLEMLNPDDIKHMNVETFYLFLHDTYFVWKYTAKNRLATTRAQLKRHLTDITTLAEIQNELFSFDKAQIRTGLEIASRIRGLGIAGASGLLSVLFPDYFGTVDQFVVKSLLRINELNELENLVRMRPEALTLADGVVLEQLLRAKADELNRIFQTCTWTPRKIDKILWAYREKGENLPHIDEKPNLKRHSENRI